MSDYQLRALQIYTNLMTANGVVHAYKSAAALGIFAELAQGQRTVAQLADALNLDPDVTGLLLETLRPIGAIERYGDDYALSQAMGLFGPASQDLGDVFWNELQALAKSGQKTHHADEAKRSDRAAHYRALAIHRQWSMTPAALELRRVLGLDGAAHAGQRLEVLDLGAGSGVWSLALAYHDPSCHITLVDLPEVLGRAVQTAKDIGLSERVSAIQGGHLDAELPSDHFDLALLANVLHQYSEEDSQRIVARAYRALKPGGELALVDIVAGQQAGDSLRTQQALQIALQTSGGVHAPEALQSMLRQEGFEQLRFAPLSAAPHTLGVIVARRPAADK